MSASVVITSYNQRHLLREAIGSALAQTESLQEIVVADDASTDGSAALIAELERHHPGVVRGVCRPVNVGIPGNRNAGLEAVTGEWVAVLDGDDILHPRFIETLLERSAAAPRAGAVYSNHSITDAGGRLLRQKFTAPQPAGDVLAHLASGAFGLMRSMLVRTQLVREVGGLDSRFPKHDGYVFTLRLARLTQFAYVHESLVTKRDHPGGDSKTFDDAARRRYLGEVYEAVKDEIVDLASSDQQVVRDRWERRLADVDALVDAVR